MGTTLSLSLKKVWSPSPGLIKPKYEMFSCVIFRLSLVCVYFTTAVKIDITFLIDERMIIPSSVHQLLHISYLGSMRPGDFDLRHFDLKMILRVASAKHDQCTEL